MFASRHTKHNIFKIAFCFIILFSCFSVIAAQDADSLENSSGFKTKIGQEIHRNALVLGLGWDFNLSHSILSTELNLVGGLWLCGIYSYDIIINKNVKIAPQIGLGLLPIPVSATTFVVGFNVSYRINDHNFLFLESRIYSINNDKLSDLGRGETGIENIYSQKPLVIMIGISF